MKSRGSYRRDSKTVRLGVPEDFAGRRMIDLLSGLARKSPHARLDTISGWSFELRRLLQTGEIDPALVKREPGDGACIARWQEQLVWVGDPALTDGNDPVFGTSAHRVGEKTGTGRPRTGGFLGSEPDSAAT